MARSSDGLRSVVLVEAARTPFLRSQGAFADLMAYELGAMAVSGLLARTRLDPKAVDRLVMGTVIADPRTSNLAREVAMVSGMPKECAAFTVTAACVSSLVAASSGIEAIASGQAGVVIAGGAELLSDPPIRVRRPLRKRLMAAQKARGIGGFLAAMKGLKPADLLPEVPALAEFTTGLTMGENGERLAKRLGITREEQDAWALASHQRAARATADGHLGAEIVPALVPPGFVPITRDDGIRGDTTLEKLARLPPVFDRRFGTVTAGNSSFLTDGASACLLASEERAKALGLVPRARVAASAFVAVDPLEELLLGPVFAIPKALDEAGIGLADVGVFELHEAFAVPVVAAMKLLADEGFCRERLGRTKAAGTIPREKLNAWGGSLSLGHPFGATGGRLLGTCARRMEKEGARYGVVSACAAGALGHAIVLSRA